MSPRILLNALFLHFPHSGTGRYLARLIDELPDELDLGLIGARAFPPRGDAPHALRLAETPFDARPALAKVWFEQWTSVRAAAGSGARLLHVPYFAPPLRARLPTVVTVHDLVPVLRPEYRRTAAQRLYVGLVCRGLRSATRIITDSRASAGDLGHVLGVAPERVRVIPLAVERSFRPVRVEERDRAAAVRAGLGVEGPYLHYLGGLDRRKNVDRLLAAFAQVKRANDAPHQLVIVAAIHGDDALFYDPRPDVERFGLADSVRLIERVTDEEARALHAASDAFVFPSLYEGFGLPPLEALACGAPVVCSKASSLPEVVGDAAVLVNAGDVGALVDGIRRVLTDAELRAELAARGPTRAAAFTWSATARATAEVYREVMEARP